MKNATHERRIREGKCTRCDKPNDNPTHRQCSECREWRKWRDKELRDQKAAGRLCVRCGKPNTTTLVKCPTCHGKRKSEKARWEAKQAGSGKCRLCSGDAVPGLKYCEKHRSFFNKRHMSAERIGSTTASVLCAGRISQRNRPLNAVFAS